MEGLVQLRPGQQSPTPAACSWDASCWTREGSPEREHKQKLTQIRGIPTNTRRQYTTKGHIDTHIIHADTEHNTACTDENLHIAAL